MATGIYGNLLKRAGEVQTYTDGTPIHEGDVFLYQQTPGGLLPPNPPEVVTARFNPRLNLKMDEGLPILYGQAADGTWRSLHHICTQL